MNTAGANRQLISIHALREEGDQGTAYYLPNRKTFLSTPSARRATFKLSIKSLYISISIHALREEGDIGAPGGCRLEEISIHALREEGDLCPGR